MEKTYFDPSWRLDFYFRGQLFLAQIFQEMQTHKIELKNNRIDHICYRTETEEEYFQVKSEVSVFAEMLSESIVGDRPIASYKLAQPFWFRGNEIAVLEVPAPKAGKMMKSGFEHIEIVTAESLTDLEKKYQDLKPDVRGLQKKINPELEIVFASGAIKFHHISLEEVIRQESVRKNL